jgi:predicted ATPase/serine/threonine protein kinase
MDDTRRKRVDDLYRAVLERKPDQREAFLASACRDDLGLWQEVESLLNQNGDDRLSTEATQTEGDPSSESGLSQLSAGARLGHYQIEAILGHGGMGEVYRARDAKLGRQVAIKVLPSHLAADAAARERLRREAAAAAALDHPFLCKVFEIGEEREVLFLTMEFIDGETLHQRLRRGSLPLPEALRFAGEVAEGLEKAHSQRFVHRDLKPANVMIANGHVKVMDFGLAKPFDAAHPIGESAATMTSDGPALTGIGAVIGTPDYMSPEQVRGEPLDQRSDLFSFGILLCEMLGTAHPFHCTSPTETIAAILRDPPNLTGDLPQGLMLLIRRLLAKSREERYQSLADVRADLGRLTTGALTAEPQAEPEGRIPLIGRDVERKELLRHLDEALAGRGSMVMIGGEAGIGKTHLVTAILEEARHRGAYANIGHCYEMEGAPPYMPFIEMLEHTARVAPKEGFRLALGDAASEIAKLMPELRQMYLDIPAAIQLPPEQQRRYLFNAYRAYIERGAKSTPVILVFEDLHWADEPTLLLLQHVAQTLSTTPLLVIGTHREAEAEVTRPFAKTLETLLRQKRATRISLRRLAVEGVESLLMAMSGQQPPPSLARVVFEETEGNPFFVEEVFRHLSEEGRLFEEAGQWRPGLRVDQLQVPEGVRLVLGRRLDRLGGDARRVLTTAAVIGRSFSLRLLEELENQQPDAALEAIEEAERAHMVSAEPAGREPRYRFVHELVRQTLSEILSLPSRQRLHARVAEAIERVYAANLESHASQLAHHLYQAGGTADPLKTTAYLMLSAKSASAGAAHEEALAHLENALSLWEGEQSVRVADLTEQRAAVWRSIGRRDEAVDGYRKAMALFEGAGEEARAAAIGLALAADQVWHVEFAAAHRSLDRALERVGSASPQLKMGLLAMRAVAMSSAGDSTVALGLLAEIKAQLKAAGQEHNSIVEGMEMACRFQSMQFEQILNSAPRFVQALRAAGNLWDVAHAECYVLRCELYCGRTAEFAGRLPGEIQLAERVGHHGAVWANKNAGAALSLARGDLIAAVRDAEEAWKFGEAHQVPWRFVSSIALRVLEFLRGNFAEAEGWLRERTEIEERTFWSGYRDACLFAFGAEWGTKADFKGWTNRCWKLPLMGQANPLGAWLALERSVIGLAWLGRREEAAALRPLTEELLLTGAWAGPDLSPFRTAAGIAAGFAGDWSAAEQHHLTAIEQTDTAPYRVSQPTAREWYASMLLDRNGNGDAAKARDLLSEALAMYESMGMPFHANRTSARLAAELARISPGVSTPGVTTCPAES